METKYPLLFGFNEVVLCKGFIAGVRVQAARALVVEEEPSSWWISGVNPGALADGGQTFSSAIQNFCARFRSVMSDYAAEADSFEEFSAAVTAFFNGTDAEEEAEWLTARAKVRASSSVKLGDLQRESADKAPHVSVTLLAVRPQDNVRTEPNSTLLAA